MVLVEVEVFGVATAVDGCAGCADCVGGFVGL